MTEADQMEREQPKTGMSPIGADGSAAVAQNK